MTALASAPEFEQALGDLQDHLPSTWRASDPSSQLYLLLQAGGALIDQISALWEQPYLDQVIGTASDSGLQRNFIRAWGLLNEQLPTVLAQLRAYVTARAAEDGSTQSLLNTLTAIVNVPANQGGPLLTFPAGGGGLTFPADGSGLVLYQYTSPPAAALAFPANGSGLTFPANGSGLTFGTFALVNFLPNFATSTLTLQVLSYLAFDRTAFARAVARFQPADWLPTVIQEVTSF